jgi:hypothetical protein
MENTFEAINHAKFQRFVETLRECIVRGEPPVNADEFVDFIEDWYSFKETHKRSSRADMMPRYLDAVRHDYEHHNHATEWYPSRLKSFNKTGRSNDELVTEIHDTIRELAAKGKKRREINAEIRRLFPGRTNYPQDVSRVLGRAKSPK